MKKLVAAFKNFLFKKALKFGNKIHKILVASFMSVVKATAINLI